MASTWEMQQGDEQVPPIEGLLACKWNSELDIGADVVFGGSSGGPIYL